MRGLLAFVLLSALPALAGPAGDIARAIAENTFDPAECYRVRDLKLSQADISLYLTDGHLIFSQPVAGRRIAAVFTADTDGGDAEIIVLPPNRAERRALAAYIKSPNLDEHFNAAVLLFTGDAYEQLKAQIDRNPFNRKDPEAAPALSETWTPVLRHLSESYQTRLALDLLSDPPHGGLFAGMLDSKRFGNIDAIYDPSSAEQVLVGQIVTRGSLVFFDTWTSFEARSRRGQPPPRSDVACSDYRIEATVNPDLSMSVVTRVKIKPGRDLKAIPFDITPQMQVADASVDGKPAEVLQRDAMRVDALRHGNSLFVVVPPEPLRAGREYELEFHHSGRVILDAGDRVYYVAARANWYPVSGMQFVTYDLQFRYPRDLSLVTAGDVVEDRTEGEWRITRRRTSAPIRMAGFNLGDYEHARAEQGGYTVDVYANRALERALQPRLPLALPPAAISTPASRRGPDPISDPAFIVPPPAPDPVGRLRELAGEVASALQFMASRFGPPTLPHLTVAPIPGAFGQGFPGLIYLSTLSYLNKLPASEVKTEDQELFFETVLQAHETAHQWWGNRVAAAAYRDNWLMEALANYSALLFVEKTKGPEAMRILLASYRDTLLLKNESGQTIESAGPIILGTRLSSSNEPRGWQSITYGKGSWIIHMLRERMGEERFLAMLAEMLRKYDRQEVTTEEFRQLAASFLPPKSDDPKLEGFFEQWVYGTGIPTLKLSYSVKGKAPNLRLTGTVTQSGVDRDFAALVPVEIQSTRARSTTQWVRAGSEPVTFTVALRQAPLKVALDPNGAVLRTK